MSTDLDDIDDVDDLDDSDESSDESESEKNLSDKERALVSLESRRRLEQKLEDARIQKQVQEYDFDDDDFD
jgi:hypothetical protein